MFFYDNPEDDLTVVFKGTDWSDDAKELRDILLFLSASEEFRSRLHIVDDTDGE